MVKRLASQCDVVEWLFDWYKRSAIIINFHWHQIRLVKLEARFVSSFSSLFIKKKWQQKTRSSAHTTNLFVTLFRVDRKKKQFCGFWLSGFSLFGVRSSCHSLVLGGLSNLRTAKWATKWIQRDWTNWIMRNLWRLNGPLAVWRWRLRESLWSLESYKNQKLCATASISWFRAFLGQTKSMKALKT